MSTKTHPDDDVVALGTFHYELEVIERQVAEITRLREKALMEDWKLQDLLKPVMGCLDRLEESTAWIKRCYGCGSSPG